MEVRLCVLGVWLSLCMVCTLCMDIKIAAILPEDEARLFSSKRVSPAIEYAIEYLQRDTDFLRGHTVHVAYRDSNCSSADGINHAINYYMEKKVDVFFGPVCDYSVAPVARQVLFWNLPLLSTGAMAGDFTSYRHTEYQLLSRVGPVNFDNLSSALINILHYYQWNKIKIIYDKEGQGDVMEGFCHLAASGVHYNLVQKAPYISQDYFKLTTDEIAVLKDEVGITYSGT